MAKRRMLSIDFCESDSFYFLSPTARMLYVHFILNADDDGFVDKWRTVLRCSRIESRHYRTLRDQGYILELSERLIVITDWHRHNTIRADRYIATAYTKELQGLRLDENKRYFKASEDVLVNQCVPQSREEKIREDKNIPDNNRIEEEKKKRTTTTHSYIHSDTASQNELTSGIDLDYNRFLSQVKFYFLTKYQSIDCGDFIEYYEKRNWIGNGGESVKENYKEYIDRWHN